MKRSFEQRLAEPRPLLLDGATGTELSRRGVDLNSPSWTAGVILDRPELLRQIHRDYVEAGAEIITANTFRTHARNLRSLGRESEAADLTARAVDIAQAARNDQVYIAGSVAPLEDCYQPELTPSLDQLQQEHGAMAEALVRTGVDLILIETQITVREARIAATAASETGLPFCVSFVCDRSGNLLSGETLEEGFAAVASLRPKAILVNCVPAEEILADLLPLHRKFAEFSLGAYANTGRLLPNGSWEATSGVEPAVYAGFASSWRDAGLKIIGGCCGTTPKHISAIRDRL